MRRKTCSGSGRALLARDPAARAGADEVRHALGVRRESMPPMESAFVGREEELETLRAAFERARRGVSVAALVHGASGIGKSALVERFVRGLDVRPLDVVRRSLLEHESVPYTGMDAVVDALSSHLRTLSDADVRAMLPDDAGFLVRLFPVLAQVGELADAADRARLRDVDGVELRARAFFALRELFGAVARRSAVVVAIDDLQWGDADTAPLLRELLRAPGVLFVGSYRTDDVRTSPLLSRLLPIDGDVEVVDLPLSPLRETELEALALAQLGPLPPEVAARIATEARGSAFFVHELVHWARGGSSLEGVDLTDVLRRRVDALDERERALLTVVCVAGRPLGRDLARRASGASGDPQPLVSALRRGGLLRSRRDVEGSVVLEPFHDLVRRAVTDGLASTRTRAVHTSLAEAYAKESRPDEEALAWHWEGAGELERAAHHAVRAAEAAFGALAWERAVRLYRSALAWREPTGDERVRIHERLGEALANAGWGSEAADAYGRARRAATGSERVDLWRREAQHLLTTGRVDEGYRALERVLHEVGLELPSTRRALLEIMVARGKLALRGLDFTPRAAEEIDETTLRRIDVCLSAGVAFSSMDSARGAALVARALFDALEVGEPHRVTRASCFVAAFSSARGTDTPRVGDELLGRAHALAQTLDDPALRALAIGAASLRAFHLGEWARAFELGERSESLFRERCLGVGKERATLQAFDASALLMMGRFEEAGQRLPRLLADAQARGDHFAASNFCAGIPHTHWLVRDASEETRTLVEDAAAHWTRRGYHVQHFFFAWALAQTDLYENRGGVGVSRLLDAERRIAGTAIERMQTVRVFLHHLAGRVAVSIGEPPTRHVRALEREPRGDAAAWASAIRGAAAARAGDSERASRELTDAVAGFTSLGLRAWAIAARRADARVCGDHDGVVRAEAALASLGVRNPPRFARCFVPVD
ncbi:MAG: AAA family ATPase [Polyangiales bacterium]